MEINVRDDTRIVEVWLAKDERNDAEVRARLAPLYSVYKPRRYTVAVFVSGGHDLTSNTLELLKYNKKRIAELEVIFEKNGDSSTL